MRGAETVMFEGKRYELKPRSLNTKVFRTYVNVPVCTVTGVACAGRENAGE